MKYPQSAAITDTSFQIETGYRSLIYSKTATAWHTLEGYWGTAAMDEMFQKYYRTWSLKHPRKEDLFAIVRQSAPSWSTLNIDQFLEQVFDGSDVCDYAVVDISVAHTPPLRGIYTVEDENMYNKSLREGAYQNEILIQRLGGVQLPQEIIIEYENGTYQKFSWDGLSRIWKRVIASESPVKAVYLDKESRILLDIDLTNNSLIREPARLPKEKIRSKLIHIFQTIWAVL